MKRLLAITMILLFGLTLAVPLITVHAARSLPPCCRRAGQHHCMNLEPSAERTFSAPATKCPAFPNATITSNEAAITPAIDREPGASLLAHPASIAQTEARYRTAYARSRQKRGPPTHFL